MQENELSRFDWYAVAEFTDLQQGDLLLRCPILQPDPGIYHDILAGNKTSQRSVQVVTANVVVMSQSCDLAKPNCTQVLVCPFKNAVDLVSNKDQRAEVAKERHAAYHMIEACNQGGLVFEQQIIDFRTVYGAPKEYLLNYATALGKRARLLPPYREHLAQAFARYFMRVGLPRNLKPL
jgi:hypothetical protein